MKEKEENRLEIESYRLQPIFLTEKILEVYNGNIRELKNKAYSVTLCVNDITDEPLINLSAVNIFNQSFEWEKIKRGDEEIIGEVYAYLRKDVYVRESVAKRLVKLNKRLQEVGHHLYVRSGFRHPLVQEVRFLMSKEKFGEKHARSRLATKDDLVGADSNYPHATGGVVDVEIWRDGKRIAMGEKGVPVGTFDLELLMSDNPEHREAREGLIQIKLSDSSPKIPEHWEEYLKNRRLLYHLMREAGFYFIFDEFWHWGMGDRVPVTILFETVDKSFNPCSIEAVAI